MSLPSRPSYAIESNDLYPGVRVGAKVTYWLVRTNIVAVGDGRINDITSTEDEIAGEYPLGHPYTQDRVLQPSALWELFAERAFELERVGITEGFGKGFATGNYTVTVEWTKPGLHKIRCFVEVPPPWPAGRLVVEVQQDVLTPEEDEQIAVDLWTGATLLDFARGLADLSPAEARANCQPERLAIELFRTIEIYEQLERRHPTKSPAASDAYDRLLTRQRKVASRLYDLVLTASAVPHQRYAVRAMHAAGVDNVGLKLFLAFGTAPRVNRFEEFGAERTGADDEVLLHRVQLVDWSDATADVYSGCYAGIHHERALALRMALLHWAADNHYPEGTMRFELPPEVAEMLAAAVKTGRLAERDLRTLERELGLDVASHVAGQSLQGSFETGGGIDVAAALDGVALTAGLAAMVAAFTAPVPGGRVAAGLIWASVVAGASASTIRIVSRHQRDVSDWMSDAIDGLSIVASLLAMPGAASLWKRGANVALREVAVIGSGTKLLRRALVGQIVADALQGVLIAADELTALQEVLSDQSKHPADRLERALGLVSRLAVAGALVVISVRGNLDDVRALESTLTRERLRRLGDPDAEIDLTDGAASRGRTQDGPHQSIANVDPAADGRVIVRRPQLTAEARTALGEFDVETGAKVRRMLDADGQAANLLFERFGRRALSVADEFETVWTRWRELALPDPMLRVYHKHTGLDGVHYFARQPKSATGRAEYIEGGWACAREEEFHRAFPSAGHSVARHGPHVPDGPGEALELRITTGIAPDGLPSPTMRSSRFLSFRDWNDAHDSAYITLREQFGLAMDRGPILGSAGQPFPIAGGYIGFRDIDDPSRVVPRALGEGYEAVVDGLQRSETFRRPDGSTYERTVYPTTHRVSSRDIRHVYTTLGWTGTEWIVINLYPAKLPNPTTVVGLARQPRSGNPTI